MLAVQSSGYTVTVAVRLAPWVFPRALRARVLLVHVTRKGVSVSSTAPLALASAPLLSPHFPAHGASLKAPPLLLVGFNHLQARRLRCRHALPPPALPEASGRI